MGKKRITDMSAPSAPKEKKQKPDHKGRKIVRTGKESGRLTDMGAIALAEAEEIKQKEKELEDLTKKAAKAAQKPKAAKKARKRGQAYLKAKKQVDRTKFYPLSEAISLVKKTSFSNFKGKIELHLTVKEKGLKRKVEIPHPLGKQKAIDLVTEKKHPLIHLVVGQAETKDAALIENCQVIIASIGPKNIKKAVVCATMGPGVKINPEEKL